MRLFFVRHGKTNYNRLGIMNDNPKKDVHLTKRGKRQAEKAAQQLKDTPLKVIYISQLPRTRQTAEIINKYHGLKPIQDKRINDNITGFDGKPWFFAAVAFLFAKDRYNARFNGGESLNDSKERVTEFLEDIKQKHPDESILIVGHVNTGQIIKGYVQGLSDRETFTSNIRNGQVMEYEL